MQLERALASYLPRRWGLFAGNAALFAWSLSLFSSPLLSGGASYMHIHVWAMLAIVAAALALAAVAPRRLFARTQALGAGMFAAAGLVATALIRYESAAGRGNLPVLIAAYVLAGATLAWATVAWQTLMARGGIRSAVLLLVGSSTMGFAIYLLVMAVPETVGQVLATLLPVAACVLAPFAAQTRRTACTAPHEPAVPGSPTRDDLLDPADVQDAPAPDAAPLAGKPDRLTGGAHSLSGWIGTAPYRLLVIVAALSLVNGLIRTSGSLANIGFSDTYEWLAFALSNLLANAIGGAVAFYAHRRRIAVAFDVALPVIALGCIAAGAVGGGWAFTGNLLVAVGAQTIVTLAWVVLVGNSIVSCTPGNGVFALLLAFQYVGIFAGQALGSAAVLDASGAAYLSLFALLLVAIALTDMQSRLAVSHQAMEGTPVPSFAERVSALADACGLTPRERQVFALWAAGHSGAHLQEELGITKNTLKTHLGHIYEKTGVANREELIALVERS